MSAPLPETRSITLRVAQWIVATMMLVAALAYLQSALAAVANFGLRNPYSDHYRIYANFFSLPLYEAIFGIENAHRPVIAALVRYAELRWFDANQMLQLALGNAFAFATAGLLALTAWREQGLPLATRAAGVFVGVASVFWFANARMLFHGGEAMHVYPVVLSTVGAILATYAASKARPAAWLGLASILCTIATFSFGSGIASFACLFAVALCVRLPLRQLAIPVVFFSAAMLFYLIVLPGNEGVRGSFVLDPLAILRVALRWLAAPWIVADHGMLLAPSRRLSAASAIGAIGISIYAWQVFRCLRIAPSKLQTLGLGMATLAVTTALLIGATRFSLMTEHPDQAFADRYLVWSCQFWGGLLLWAIGTAHSTAHSFAAAATAGVLAFALWPMHTDTMIWASIVHRGNERSAVAARLDILDEELLPSGFDANREQMLETLRHFRANGLDMFRDPVPVLSARSKFATTAISEAPVGSEAKIASSFHDAIGERTVLRIEGIFAKGMAMPHYPVLEIIDAQGYTRGEAVLNHFPDFRVLRWSDRPMRGFDGYLPSPEPGTYRLVLADAESGRAMYAIVFCIDAATAYSVVP